MANDKEKEIMDEDQEFDLSEVVKRNEKGKIIYPVNYPLQEPIEWGDEQINEVKIRKPFARHIRMLPDSPKTSDVLDVAGSLMHLTPKQVDRLAMEDTINILEIVGEALGRSRLLGR